MEEEEQQKREGRMNRKLGAVGEKYERRVIGR